MAKLICSIYDKLGEEMGPLVEFKHPAQAIRFFGDMCLSENSPIRRHIADHDLYQLGIVNDDNELVPEKRILITGAQWLAAQTRADTNTGEQN